MHYCNNEPLDAVALRYINRAGDLPNGDREFRIGTTSKTAVATFNLPAFLTCPGRTAACSSICFVPRSQLSMGSKAHMHNLARFERYERNNDLRGCAGELASLIRPFTMARIHGSGDFHSQFVVDAWTEALRKSPRTAAWCYTRSTHLDLTGLAARNLPSNFPIISALGA